MTTIREAATIALKTLECPGKAQTSDEKTAIIALRAALAEPLQPVAWMVYTIDGKAVYVTDNPTDFTDQHKALPLYTAPPQRKPLSIASAMLITTKTLDRLQSANGLEGLVGLVRAIEQAHGITE